MLSTVIFVSKITTLNARSTILHSITNKTIINLLTLGTDIQYKIPKNSTAYHTTTAIVECHPHLTAIRLLPLEGNKHPTISTCLLLKKRQYDLIFFTHSHDWPTKESTGDILEVVRTKFILYFYMKIKVFNGTNRPSYRQGPR